MNKNICENCINPNCDSLHLKHMGIVESCEDLEEDDHKDGERANNQVWNLRMCTSSQNKANAKSRKNSASKYKGVFRIKNGRWQALIGKNRQVYHVGTYATEEKAAEAYNKKHIELYGEFAKINVLGERSERE